MKQPTRLAYVLGPCAAATLIACAPMPVSKEVVSTTNAPAAIGPYSQAIRYGNMLFLAGQIPIDVKTNQVPAHLTSEYQPKMVIEHLRSVLEANG